MSGTNNRPSLIDENDGIATTDNAAFSSDFDSLREQDISDQSASTMSLVGSEKKNVLIVVVLVTINLLNYMDRFTIAGLLDEVKEYYKISDSSVGLLQTAFILSYMSLSPVFGYLGDRYNRKYIMVGGVTIWSIVTLSSSFVPSNMFPLFLFMRALVGIGEASYSTVAPTILADLFSNDLRTKVLAMFFFATPVGSGLGYIVGSVVFSITQKWQWALRFTPVLGLFCILLTIFLIQDPPRGKADCGGHLAATSWLEDIRKLLHCPSFVLVTLGFTTVAFVTGALTWWAVFFMNAALNLQTNDKNGYENYPVSITFGAITCVAGLLGVGLGVGCARKLRPKTPRADTYVCAVGMFVSIPFLYGALLISRYNYYITMALVFIGESALCMNWALVTDMTLSVVVPTRRSTASALQMLVSHALGDAGSPYVVGLMSELLQKSRPVDLFSSYITMMYALLIMPFICILGGAFFLGASLFIFRDRKIVEDIIHNSREYHSITGGTCVPISSCSTSTDDVTNRRLSNYS